MIRNLITICLVLILASASSAKVDVIGNWENMPTSGDKWRDWDQGQNFIEAEASIGDKFSSEPTIGVTLNDYSLHVLQTGWSRSLAIKLQDVGMMDEFMTHNTFSLDVTVAAAGPTITGGYSQVNAVYMNAPGPGWTTVASGNPVNFYWWAGSPQRTLTLNVDYTAFRNAITNPNSYIEIILALNTGDGAPPDMYFDNASLSGVPEPATIALLGLGGLALLRRKR
jgi:hypothetical protein